MAVNKVEIMENGSARTIIDLTEDTVEPEALAEGYTAHDPSGQKITGKMPTTTVLYTEQTLTNEQKAQARENIGAVSEENVSSYSTVVYGTCSTAAATAEKAVTVDNENWELSVGSVVMVRFDVSNSASNVTLNVNGTGAYPIWYNNAEYTSTGTAYTGYAKRVTTYMFNGTHWVWIANSYDSNTTYKNVALGHGYATCSTAAATAAKVGTLASYALTVGGIVAVKFTNAVPANATLNINSKGTKNIFYRGAKIVANVIKADDIATFIYDGTQYQLLSIDRWQEDVSRLQETIADQVVKKVDLYQTVLSSNIFDFDTLQAGYLAGDTGKIYTGGSYDNYMYSEMYIPVNEGDVVTVQYNLGSNARSDSATTGEDYCFYCAACYDSNKNFVQGFKGGSKVGYYTIPSGVSYIRVCFQASLINNSNISDMTIVKNSAGVPIAYEPYGEYLSEIIKEEHLPTPSDNSSGGNGVLYVSLVDKVHVKTGSEFKVYFRNIISRSDTMLWIGYHNSLTTRYYDEYFTVLASSEGEFELPWKVYDMGGNLLESGTLTIDATTKVPTDTTTAIVIGDSTVNAGTMTDKAVALYTADGATLSLLGTRGNGHEGRGGWTAEMYCTLASSGGIANPFYNNGFDFSYYMENQNYSGVQAVVIQLGINDIFAFKDYSWAQYDSTEVLDYINQMVTSVLAYNPTINVIINLPITPNSNGTSFTEAYGTTQLYWIYNRNIIRFAKELKEYFKSNTSVTISASNCILDTKTQISDGVHPTSDGYNALGQRLYEVLVSIVDGQVVVIPLLDISQRTRVNYTGKGTVSATSVHELDTSKCYDSTFSGIRGDSVSTAISVYNVLSNDSFQLQTSNANGTGVEFPLALEVGKTYTLKVTADVANSRIYLIKYNSDGTYNSNKSLSTMSTPSAKSFTLTPEEGFIYSVGFHNVHTSLATYSGISLEEN